MKIKSVGFSTYSIATRLREMEIDRLDVTFEIDGFKKRVTIQGSHLASILVGIKSAVVDLSEEFKEQKLDS